MKSIYLLLSLLFIKNFCVAQVDESKSFLYLYTDSVIYGRTIELKKPIFGNPYFLIDTAKIKTDLVKFYKVEKGFFANTKDLGFSGSSEFSERISKGKINLYEKQSTHYTMNTGANGMYGGGTVTKSIKNYYNTGYDSLRKATYKNLSIDLANNPESIMHLGKYNSNTKTQNILYVTGGSALLGGIIFLVSNLKTDKVTNNPQADVKAHSKSVAPAIALIGTGAACFWINYYISLSKPAHIKRAIDAYNY